VNVIFTPSGETVGLGTLNAVSLLPGHKFVPLTIKIVPWAKFGVLLAASQTAVIDGGGAVTVPPVLMVPVPEKVSVIPDVPIPPDPDSEGKEPVSPA